MKKRIMSIGIGVIAVVVILFAFGFFPAALIGRDIILYHDFSTTAQALEQYQNTSKKAAGESQLSASEVSDLRKSVLENMIATVILEQYMRRENTYDTYAKNARELIASALKSTNAATLPKATDKLYGLGVEDFQQKILFPQALQDALRQGIEKDGKNFADIVSEELRKPAVRTFVVPWYWQDGHLVSKK